MNKPNYDKQMQDIIMGLNGKKPTLLLHSCCAPCSSSVIEKLKEFFEITVFYYNPNIDDEIEYQKRLLEQKTLCQKLNVGFLEGEYDVESFRNCAVGLEKISEGGKRCFNCYELRLTKAAKTAKAKEFEYFTTTLTVSPLKNADKLNQIGIKLQDEYGVKFLPSDFKKRGGYLRSIELSKEFSLYRQNYCGCSYSKN